MGKFILSLLFLLSAPALAYEPGGMFFDPHVAVGYNVAQGTYVLLGADAGYAVSEQLAAGVGGFYSFGEHPEHDRAMGGGPFAEFFQPLASFLVASVREDVDYIDQNAPIFVEPVGAPSYYTHVHEFGVASVTSLALHIRFTQNLGVTAGYRAVLSLSNTDIGKDRSGTFLGVSIGI